MSTAVTSVDLVSLKWVSDEAAVRSIQSEVDSSLFAILDDQRTKLDQVDAKAPGKSRRQRAREVGVLCAIAKGVQNRELKPNRIHIPSTELTHLNGKVRISALKATLPIPEGVHVKSVTFQKDGPEYWYALLEVKDVAACAS